MHSTHHCEDKEHNGAPTYQCIPKLHVAYCPAPVIDKDPESETYGQVVICGERFKVLSPKGCAQHPYSDGFNLDFKNARNDRPKFEIRYKKIFENFKVEHAEELACMAKKREALQMRANMSEPQKQRLRAQQDKAAYEKACQLEATRRRELIQQGRLDEIGKEYTLKGPGVPLANNSRESKQSGGWEGQRGNGLSQSCTPLGPLGNGLGPNRSGSCQPAESPASFLRGPTSDLSKNQSPATLPPTSRSFAPSGGLGNGQTPVFPRTPGISTTGTTYTGKDGIALNTSSRNSTYMVASAAQYGDLTDSSLGSIEPARPEDQSQKAPPRHGSTTVVSQHPDTALQLLGGLEQPPNSEGRDPTKVVGNIAPGAPEQPRKVTRAAEAHALAPPRRKEAKEAKKLRAAETRAAAMAEAARKAAKAAEQEEAAKEAAEEARIRDAKSTKVGKTKVDKTVRKMNTRKGKTVGNGRR